MDSTTTVLVILGFVLVLGSLIALTTTGAKHPAAVLVGIFLSFTAYIFVILVRIGAVDLSWLGL